MDGAEVVEAVLPVGPWALAAVATVLVVALSVPAGGPRPADVGSPRPVLAGPLGALLLAVAAVAVVLVARLGPASELRNPVPALVVGLGWPLLLLVPGVVGLLLGRPRGFGTPGAEPAPAWPAAVAALAVVCALTLPVSPTRPAAVATAVAAYALAVTAAGIALGRRRVAASGEVLGLLVAWGRVGRALPRWAAPRGALAVLAVVLGGAWFERFERSDAWTTGLPDRAQTIAGLAVALLAAGAGAAALARVTRAGAAGTAAATLLPLALATGIAGAARRAMISAQLLADQAAGPRPIEADPLGVLGGQVLALAVVTVGGALSSVVLARRMGEETARLPGVGVLLLLTGVSAWVVLQH